MTEIEQLVTGNHDVLSAIQLTPHGYIPMYSMSAGDEETLQSLGHMVLHGHGSVYRLTDLGRALVRRLAA